MAKELKSKIKRKTYKFQYAAKFVCTANIPNTSQQSDAVLPGSYQTAVNVHNPSKKRVRIRVKLASSILISPYKDSELGPDGVERFVCNNITDFIDQPIHGFEGFLVIESTGSLDVIAVYTAGGTQGQVTSLDVERVKERKL